MARSKRPLYIPLFPADFMGDPNVRSMSNTQIGIYMILIMTAWQETPPCSLPDDPPTLCRWALCKSMKDWKRLSPPVMACWTIVDGRWVNFRLLREYNGRVEAAERAAKKGESGAAKRWHGHSTGIEQPMPKHEAPAIVLPMPSDGSRIPYPVSRVLIPTTTTTAREESLSGIELTEDESAAADKIFAAATDAMRPKGNAAAGWVLPLHEANRLSGIIDATMKAGTAFISEREWHPWELADEFAAAVRGSNPAGVNGLCNFIDAVWKRCQRSGCKPGDPHKSNSLKIERQKPADDTSEMDAAMAKVQIEIDRQEAKRSRR